MIWYTRVRAWSTRSHWPPWSTDLRTQFSRLPIKLALLISGGGSSATGSHAPKAESECESSDPIHSLGPMGISLVSLRLGKTDEVLKVLSNVARRQIEIEQQQQREQQREEQECDEEDVEHGEGEMPMIPSSPDGHTLEMRANDGDTGDGDGVTLGGDCTSGEGKERDKEAEGDEGWGETGKEAVKEGKESAGGMALEGQAQHQVIIIQSKIFIIHSLFFSSRALLLGSLFLSVGRGDQFV